jgi:hypothetical protein
MKNALVTMTYRLNIGEGTVQKILNSRMLTPDDGSDEWYRSACGAIEAAVLDDPMSYLEFVSDEPDIEVDA